MNKKLSAILLFILTLCSYSYEAYSQEVYRSETNSFMISFPEGWEITKISTNIDFIAWYDVNVNVNVAVKQSTVLKGLTIEEAADENFKNTMIRQYEKEVENFVLLESGIDSAGSHKAFYMKYTGKMPGEDGILMAKQYFLISDSKMYVITTGSPEAGYLFHESMFNEIVSSFKFTF